MLDQIMAMLRARQGQGQVPQMMGHPGPQMMNMGQHFGEFSDAMAAQPGNMLRGGDLWMLQNRQRQGAGGMGQGGMAQTFPATPPPQFQAQPLGTVPQQALDLGRYGGLFGQMNPMQPPMQQPLGQQMGQRFDPFRMAGLFGPYR